MNSIERRIISQLLRYYLLVPHSSTICTYLMYNGTNSYRSDTLVVSLLHFIASHIACHIALILDTFQPSIVHQNLCLTVFIDYKTNIGDVVFQRHKGYVESIPVRKQFIAAWSRYGVRKKRIVSQTFA